jgi:hypothetical protein
MRRWRATFYEVMDTDGSHWGYGSTGELARARARGWRIVCGLLDMGGEDTPDAFLLAEVP